MTNIKIEKLIFNNGDHLDINPDDIVVFVGPNNSGKSRALKDIHECLYGKKPGIVVNDVEFKVQSKERIASDLRDFALEQERQFEGAGFTIYKSQIDSLIKQDEVTESIILFLTSFQTTEDRLKLVTPPEKIRENEPRRHPFHYIDRQRALIKDIDAAFNQAFGEHLLLNEYNGKYLSMSVNDKIIYAPDDYNERLELYNGYMSREFQRIPHLHEQGDGMKSFTGILLNFFVEHYSVFFLDEPESFLHPPQANVMGSQIVEMSKDKQLFISTHSEELLKGLIDTQSSRIKIIRITREGNTNKFSILQNGRIHEIWNDPLLRHSNIMNSLFYEASIICESNADCKFYKLLLQEKLRQIREDNSQKRKDGKKDDEITERGFWNTIFLESGGKQRLKIICSPLKELNVDFRVIPDFDIFRQGGQAKNLYNSCGGNWDRDCADDWKIMNESLPDNGDKELDRETVREKLNKILDKAEGDSLNSQDMRKLKAAIKEGVNKWDGPKYEGIRAFPTVVAKEAANRILEKFHKVNIYPVQTGEMESLVPEFKDHGKEWLNDLLGKHPNLTDDIYKNALSFITTLMPSKT